jgi:hypothetical protein
VLVAHPAAAVTPKEAQSLPVEELARRVLGEAGSLVVDVDRPKWPTCDHMCPPLTEAQRSEAPPLHLGLRFYQRPTAASIALGEWTGLCATTLVYLHYDRNGELTSFSTGQRWGVPHGMQRVTQPIGPGDFMTRLGEQSARCQGADLRDFFIADDEGTALRIAVASHLFAEAVARPGPLSFKLSCSTPYGDCRGRAAVETVAGAFRPTRFSQLNQVECAKPDREILRIGPDGCYSVMLDGPGEHILVEIADAYSELKLKRVEYSRGLVVY